MRLLLLLVLLSSCQAVHNPVTHNTPSFISNRRVALSGSIGSGLNANASFVPVNHLAIGSSFRHTKNDQFAAVELFGFHSLKLSEQRNVVFGIGGGYGQGYTIWSNWFSGFSGTLSEFHSDYEKISGQTYFVFVDDDFEIGVSVKGGTLLDHVKESVSGTTLEFNYDYRSRFAEIVAPVKIRLIKPLFLISNFGLSYNSWDPVFFDLLLVRLGLEFRF